MGQPAGCHQAHRACLPGCHHRVPSSTRGERTQQNTALGLLGCRAVVTAGGGGHYDTSSRPTEVMYLSSCNDGKASRREVKSALPLEGPGQRDEAAGEGSPLSSHALHGGCACGGEEGLRAACPHCQHPVPKERGAPSGPRPPPFGITQRPACRQGPVLSVSAGLCALHWAPRAPRGVLEGWECTQH